MSGRGNLVALFHKKAVVSEDSSTSEDRAKDSGVDLSVSSGQNQGLERANIPSELTDACKNVFASMGRGRANFFQTFKTDSQQLENKSHLNSFSTTSLEDAKNTKENRDTPKQSLNNVNRLFCPSTTVGTKGSSLVLSCNYIGLKSDRNKGVYLYEVRFNPNVDSTHLRFKYLNEHNEQLGGVKTFDGSTLYLPICLDKELTTFVSKDVNNKDVEIRILFKKKESLQNCMQLYNILFDRVMRALNYVKFDKKHFDPSRPKVIPSSKLEVWPGYVTSVDEYDGGLMLCCDVSHRLLCQKTVLDMLIEIYQHNKSQYQEKAKKHLLGSIVLTRYNNRTYKIDDISFSESPHSKFNTRLGSYSYIEYYKNHHNITIKDEKQPLLISIKKCRGNEGLNNENVRFCLIPECCYLTGLHDEIRSDKKLMREIATFTRVSPNQRMLALDKYFDNVDKNDNAKLILKNWGLSLSKIEQNLVGRKMEPEKIYFAKKCISVGENADFSRDTVSNELLKVINLKNWILIYHKNDLRTAKTFIQHMERSCEAFGLCFSKPNSVCLDQDRVDLYVDALRRNISGQTQIVVCICPSSRDDRYSAIKKICCSELPVASQIINSRTLSNETKNRSIVQKIILQMNCKMGGSLWTVKIPFKNVMICGIDSFHDPNHKNHSVAALVASLDSSYSRWYSKAVIQSKREELVNGLTSSFECALECYKMHNSHYPDSVIIYRDGVGDGQLSTCANYEIAQFEEVCSKSIKITFIVVQKRINARFFTKYNGKFENPHPGTIVDNYITRANMYDFFLVSQMVRQGSVSPTHFIVLRDDCNYGPDIIQKLSYKLCYLYYNWPGTVRIPACCLYAHKMAFLIGQSIQRDTASNLLDKLFYL